MFSSSWTACVSGVLLVLFSVSLLADVTILSLGFVFVAGVYFSCLFFLLNKDFVFVAFLVLLPGCSWVFVLSSGLFVAMFSVIVSYVFSPFCISCSVSGISSSGFSPPPIYFLIISSIMLSSSAVSSSVSSWALLAGSSSSSMLL